MEQIRVDKWLWAARFYKTRSAANAAINGGKVKVNGGPTKASLQLRVGDSVLIRKPPFDFRIQVLGLSSRRGSHSEAVMLYEETLESLTEREELARGLKQQAAMAPPSRKGRPTKRDRRQMARIRGR